MARFSGIQTPLARARGMGSAKTGSHHWWQHRITMVANIPMVIWFMISVALLAGQDYAVVRTWVGSPITAVVLSLTLFNFFLHSKMDVQIIIEDYVANKGARLALQFLVQGAIVLLGALAIFSVFKIALG